MTRSVRVCACVDTMFIVSMVHGARKPRARKSVMLGGVSGNSETPPAYALNTQTH